MKKTIVIIFVILIISAGIFIKNIYNENNTISTNSAKDENVENLEYNIRDDKKKKIQIYDIEDGYITVEYNKRATKNCYNWNNLSKDNNEFLKYEDENYKTKLGIDVSSYQGEINWKMVKEEGIKFAILRLGFRGYGTTGKIILDDTFEENYKNATEQGIAVGVYFFSQAINEEEVKEEAEFVVQKLEEKKIEYPVFYDLEKIKNDTARTDNLTDIEVNLFTHRFCEEISNKGYIPGIYGNAKTYTTRMKLEEFNDYIKWYADYQEKPIYPYDFNIWQYTESGKVNGINTNVDINIQFINKSIEK